MFVSGGAEALCAGVSLLEEVCLREGGVGQVRMLTRMVLGSQARS